MSRRSLAPRSRVSRATFTLVVAALVLASCTVTRGTPAPSPADFGGISQQLQSRGLTITDVVSGDAGCSTPGLAASAISFHASGLDQAAPVKVYLYIFADDEAMQRRHGDVDACARAYVHDAATFESLDVPPYVAVGQGPWAEAFRQRLREGLTDAAGRGG